MAFKYHNMKKVVIALLTTHFLILLVHIWAKNSEISKIVRYTNWYVNPFFTQEWEMFAPPATENSKLFFRYYIYNKGDIDTTNFREVLKPLYKRQVNGEYALSRVSYFLFNCTRNIQKSNHYLIENAPPNIKADSILLLKFVDQKIAKTQSHKSLIGYGTKLFQKKYPYSEFDSVSISYHILDVQIPDFDNRHSDSYRDTDSLKIDVWNGSHYRIL